MANPQYGYKYNPSSYSKVAGGGATADLSSLYVPVSAAEYYPSADSSLRGSSSRYLFLDPLASSSSGHASSITERAASSLLYSPTDTLPATRIPGLNVTTTSHFPSQSSWRSIDMGASNSLFTNLKRSSSEVPYHQTVLGAHNTFGQTEAWLSNNSVTKRPRYDSASNLPIYPQRPGEKDCAHYKLTRTCKFGESCMFDHPIWVPEGGIPDWKELPVTSDSPPERAGEPDCPYFLKTQKCKFGLRCKFNHPKEKISLVVPENANALPERPSEPTCTFYMKTGNCKFGANCKFNHPKEIPIESDLQENVTGVQTEALNNVIKPVKQLFTTASMHNTKGFPIRPGEVDCPFYLKTGSCKYGTTCRYNHPDRHAIDTPAAAALAPPLLSTRAAPLSFGFVNPAAYILQAIDPRLTRTTLGMTPTINPQRPGQIECDYYMKTGECKFGERCKFHHPIDRSAPALSVKDAQQQNVKLTLAGLPRREGAMHCPYYMKTGTCKYGATCKFDHPPPGEVMAMATSQGTSTTVYGEGKESGKEENP